MCIFPTHTPTFTLTLTFILTLALNLTLTLTRAIARLSVEDRRCSREELLRVEEDLRRRDSLVHVAMPWFTWLTEAEEEVSVKSIHFYIIP